MYGFCTALALDPNENILVMGSSNGHVRIYNVDSLLDGKKDAKAGYHNQNEMIRQL